MLFFRKYLSANLFRESRSAYRDFKNSRQDLPHCPRETPEMSEDTQPETSGRNQAGQFIKGRSGNPQGRPRGIRNKAAQLIETLLAGDSEAIAVSVIDAARNGDMTAARLVLDRILPARKDSPINITFPPIRTATDVTTAMSDLLASVATGELTPDEGQQLSKLLESYLKTLVSSDIEARLNAIEAKISEAV